MILRLVQVSSVIVHYLDIFSPSPWFCSLFFFFNDTATTEIYTLSLHDALPISWLAIFTLTIFVFVTLSMRGGVMLYYFKYYVDRKSTRLNSSHANISYAVFCLKKKKYTTTTIDQPTPV